MNDEGMDNFAEPDAELNRVAHAVIGAAIEVHRILGPGFLESVYERALEIEFRKRAIKALRQYRFIISYKGEALGKGALDFLVEDRLVVELKAVESLAGIHMAQVISYLRATGFKLALLINFNVKYLKDGIKRIAL